MRAATRIGNKKSPVTEEMFKVSITQKYPTLLIVDNDELGRARLAAELRARGMDVMGVPTVREALIMLRTRSPRRW